MRKQKKLPLRDFFSDYNHAKIQSTVLSVMFALLLSVSAVMVTQDVDTRGLMASVSNVASQKTYDADLVLEAQSGGNLDIVIGSEIRSPEKLSFTVLSDPEKLTSLTTTDTRAQITSLAPGAYVVTLILTGENIYPGTKLLSLHATINPSDSIGLVDTTFESAGVSYDLTSKGK